MGVSANGHETAAGAGKILRDEISMSGTVSIVHDEEYGRRWVTARLKGYGIPVTVEEIVDQPKEN